MGTLALPGCGAGSGGEGNNDVQGVSPTWEVREVLAFVAGTESTINLADTLPNGAVRGGRFAISPNGAALPPGMALRSDGVITVAATTPVGATSGVVFEYHEA